MFVFWVLEQPWRCWMCFEGFAEAEGWVLPAMSRLLHILWEFCCQIPIISQSTAAWALQTQHLNAAGAPWTGTMSFPDVFPVIPRWSMLDIAAAPSAHQINQDQPLFPPRRGLGVFPFPGTGGIYPSRPHYTEYSSLEPPVLWQPLQKWNQNHFPAL